MALDCTSSQGRWGSQAWIESPPRGSSGHGRKWCPLLGGCDDLGHGQSVFLGGAVVTDRAINYTQQEINLAVRGDQPCKASKVRMSNQYLSRAGGNAEAPEPVGQDEGAFLWPCTASPFSGRPCSLRLLFLHLSYGGLSFS